MKSAVNQRWEIVPVVEVRGEITATNFPQIKEMIAEGIASLNLDPETDEEFGQAEQDMKQIAALEKALTAAKAEALKQAADVQRLFEEIDETNGELREARLSLKRAITAKKEEVRSDILTDALGSIQSTKAGLFLGRIQDVMKGKRTIDTLRAAAETEAKQINERIITARKMIAQCGDQHGLDVIHGSPDLEVMNHDALAIELERRVERKRATEEAARARAEAEAEQRRLREEAEAERAKAKMHEASLEKTPENVPDPTPMQPRTYDRSPQSAEPAEKASAAEELAGLVANVRACLLPLRAEFEGIENDEVREFYDREFRQPVNAAFRSLMKGVSR